MRLRALSLVVALMLAGCSVLDLSSQPAADDVSEIAPQYRQIIAARLRNIIGDPARAGVLQISGVRRVNHLRGPSWLVCLKTSAFLQPRHYAIFLQGEQIVESRLAVVLDGCDGQPYETFNWVAEAPKPGG
jgi:hypothetical protein